MVGIRIFETLVFAVSVFGRGETGRRLEKLHFCCDILLKGMCDYLSEQQHKSLIIARFYGSIIRIFDVSFRYYTLGRRHKWENPLIVERKKAKCAYNNRRSIMEAYKQEFIEFMVASILEIILSLVNV